MVVSKKEALKIVRPGEKNKLAMAALSRVLLAWTALQNVFRLEGDVVEAGVYRGGTSMMMMYSEIAVSHSKQQHSPRTFWLYDTFEGMPPPSEKDDDRSHSRWEKASANDPKKAHLRGEEYVDKDGKTRWNYATLGEVQKNVLSTGYNTSKILFVKGKVEDTLSLEENLPKKIAVLRLDTDWYESTKKELNVLFPRLIKGGFLIIDDYCSWGGSRRATDEWLALHKQELCEIRSYRLGVIRHPECFTAVKC